MQRDAEPTNNRLLFCAVGRKAFCAVRIIKLDALYLQMIFTEVIFMQIELDELIKRILRQLSESDKLTAEQSLKMYQRVFPLHKEANGNGKG